MGSYGDGERGGNNEGHRKTHRPSGADAGNHATVSCGDADYDGSVYHSGAPTSSGR